MEYVSLTRPLDNAPATDYQQPVDDITDSAIKGLRSSSNAIGGQIQSLAGLAGEVVGADEFAKNRRASSLRYQQDAELFTPQTSLDSLIEDPSLSKGLRWAGGTAGSVLPYMAGTVAGTMSGLGPLAAGAAAMALPTAGAIVQRQERDPEAMKDSAGERLARAGAGGLIGGAVTSLPFGGIAGKIGSGALTGMGARTLGSRSLLGATAKNLGEGAATAGIGMGGGNVIEQFSANPNKDVNWEEAGQMAKEGAAMGALLHAPFIPGAYMRGRGEQALEAGKSLYGKTMDAVPDAVAGAPGTMWGHVQNVGNAAGKMASGAWDAKKDMLPGGEDVSRMAADVAKYVEETWTGSKDAVRATAKEIMESDDVPQAVKDAVAKAATTVFQKSSVATIETARRVRDMMRMNKAEEAKPEAPKPLDTLNRLADEDHTETKELSSIAKGDPLKGMKPEEISGMPDEQLNRTLAEKAQAAAQTVQRVGKQMLDDVGLDAATRTHVNEMLRDAADETSQRAIAGLGMAWKKSQQLGEKASKMLEGMKKTDDGTKMSEDLDGFRGAVESSVLPYIRKNMPEMFSTASSVEQRPGQTPMIHPSNFNKVTDVLNRTINEMSQGKMTSHQMHQLIDLFGSHTIPIMERLTSATGRTLTESGRVYKGGEAERLNGKGAMGENNTIEAQLTNLMRDRAGQESDPYTQQFLELARLSNRGAELEDIVRKGLTPEMQEEYSVRDLKPMIKALEEWADGRHLTQMIGSRSGSLGKKVPASERKINDPAAPQKAGRSKGGEGADGVMYEPGDLFQTEAGRLNEERIRAEFQRHFGENADMVAKVFEDRSASKHRDEPTPQYLFDADGNRIEEAELDRVVRGGGWTIDKNGEGNEINRSGFAFERGEDVRGKNGKIEPTYKMVRDDKRAESVLRDPAEYYATPIGERKFNKAHQLITAMQIEFPMHDVKWEQAEGRGKGWGYIVAERVSDPEKLSHKDVANMKADVTKNRKEDRIDVFTKAGDRLELDTLASSWAMEKKLPREEGVLPLQRMARAATEAMSRIIDTFGENKSKKGALAEIKIDPEARVGIIETDKEGNHTYMLWKDVPRYMNDYVEGGKKFKMQASSDMTAERWAKMTPEERAAHKLAVEEQTALDSVTPGDRVARKLSKDEQAALGPLPEGKRASRELTDDARDKKIISDGRPEDANLVKDVLKDNGQRGTNKSDNIHFAAGDRSAKELRHTSNEDGSASTSFRTLTAIERNRVNNKETGVNGAMDRWFQEGEHADGTIGKVQVIRDQLLNILSAKDLRAFLNLRNVSEVRFAKSIVDDMYAKYYDSLYESIKNPMPEFRIKLDTNIPQAKVHFNKDGQAVTEKGNPKKADRTAENRSTDVSFVNDPTPQNWIGRARAKKQGKGEMPESGTFTPITDNSVTSPQGELFRAGHNGTESYNVPGKAEPGLAVRNVRKGAAEVALKPIEQQIDAIRREHGANPYPSVEMKGRTKVTKAGYPDAVLDEYHRLQDLHAHIKASVEGPPDPKAVAAKKAALVKAASSSDPALLHELSTSNDVKGLQRAVDTMLQAKDGGAFPSRSSDRAEMLASNKYRNNTTTLSHMLNAMSMDPTAYLNKGERFTLENWRKHPEVQQEMAGMLAGRLKGERDAAVALHTLRHVESQHFSLENSVKTNTALLKTLNTMAKSKLGGYLDTIAKANDVPLVIREIAAKVKEIAGDVPVYGKDLGPTMGLYHPDSNKIEINNKFDQVTSSVLHEGVHAATIRALAKNEGLSKATYELMEHVAFVSKRTVNAYGMKNIGEFMAEGLSNREFQKELQGIIPSARVRKYLGDNIGNAWDAFVSVVRQALKLDPSHDSALSQLFELAGHAMKEVGKDKTKGYNTAEGQVWHDRLYSNTYDFNKTIKAIQDHIPDHEVQALADFESLRTRANVEQGVTYGEQHVADQLLSVLNDRKANGIDPFKEQADLPQILLDAIADGKVGKSEANFPQKPIHEAIDAANKRISEIIKKDDTAAYGMLLEKKYKLGEDPVSTETIKGFKMERLFDAEEGDRLSHDRWDILCQRTSEATAAELKRRFPGADVKVEMMGSSNPGAESTNNINHYVATMKVDGKTYLFDQPQRELVRPAGEGHFQLIKNSFEPRAIEKTPENLMKEYGLSRDSALTQMSGETPYAPSKEILQDLAQAATEVRINPLMRKVLARAQDGDVHLGALNLYARGPLRDVVERMKTEYEGQLNSKKSLGHNNAGPHGPLVDAEIKTLATKMLGSTVQAGLEAMGHAGDFRRDHQLHVDVLRVSKTALDPLGTLHHEALHAFFGHLRNAGDNAATMMLEKYSASAHIMDQLRERYGDNKEVMKQLADPEERAAYMFQLYKTDPTFKLAPSARTLFGKISDMLHKVLGIWTNHERAQHMMDYFERGDFARDMGNMDTVHKALMLEGRNRAIEKLKTWTEPIGRLGDGIIGVGGERLRDTGIPSLGKIADLIKSTGRGITPDRGSLTAAREVRTQYLNEYAREMKSFTADDHRQALEAMQNGTTATGNAGLAQQATQRMLDKVFTYMQAQGVDIQKFQDPNGVAYFPRVWDAHYISKNQDAFTTMMEKYTRSGQFAGDPAEVMRSIMANDGSSFNVVPREPGMQFKKERLLAFIDHADAAPFMQKELMVTMDSYITQAARRAEWAKRFGDDGAKLDALLLKAKQEGATDADIMTTETYLKGVSGTLGDNIDPGLRRLYGNTIIYQNIRLLPLAFFSSLVDPVGIAVRGGTVKQAFGAFKRGIMEIPEGFRDQSNRKGSPEERTAELLGVIDDAYLRSNLGALYNQGMVGDFGRNLNDKFFKYNLMEQYNRSMRSAATAAAIKFIEAHADGTFNAKHSRRWMEELGLDVGDIETRADSSLKLFESDGLSKEKAEKIRSAINQWVDGAILRPDAADKPIWMNDPHFALVAHLKQFTWSFQETILKRVIHEYKHGNTGPALALASYVPMMIAADAAKGLIQGAGSQPSWKQDWEAEDYLASGVQRAGLLGVGQFGVDVFKGVREGGTGLGSLAGPTFEQLGDAVLTIGGRKQFSSFALHSMPANAVYSDWVRSGGGSTVDKPSEPIAVE